MGMPHAPGVIAAVRVAAAWLVTLCQAQHQQRARDFATCFGTIRLRELDWLYAGQSVGFEPTRPGAVGAVWSARTGGSLRALPIVFHWRARDYIPPRRS